MLYYNLDLNGSFYEFETRFCHLFSIITPQEKLGKDKSLYAYGGIGWGISP